MSENPSLPWRGVIEFQTRPELESLLLDDIKEEMERFCADGPTGHEIEVAAKYLIKRHGEVDHRVSMSVNIQRDRMIETVLWGREYDYDYRKVIGGVKASDVQKLARKLASGDTLVEVYTEK